MWRCFRAWPGLRRAYVAQTSRSVRCIQQKGVEAEGAGVREGATKLRKAKALEVVWERQADRQSKNTKV